MKRSQVKVNGWYMARIVRAGEDKLRDVPVKVMNGGDYGGQWAWPCLYKAPLSASGRGVVMLRSSQLHPLKEK